MIYERIIRPFILKHKDAIDKRLNQAADVASDLMNEGQYWSLPCQIFPQYKLCLAPRFSRCYEEVKRQILLYVLLIFMSNKYLVCTIEECVHCTVSKMWLVIHLA